jgi:3-oxoacyl-[acyl-carrier-protein] synthase III
MQALITATQYLTNGTYKTAAVIGCDVGTIFGNLDKDDPTFTRQDLVNAVMIGDGAGALILQAFNTDEQGDEPHGVELVYYNMKSIGGDTSKFGMYLPIGGCVHPATADRLSTGLQYFKHDYRLVLEHGPELYLRALDDILSNGNFTLADFDMFVPHQANGKINDIAKEKNFPAERLFHNFDRVGNTANASLLLAFDEIMTKGLVADGGLVAFGAAESTKWLYACLVVRWKNLKGQGSNATRVKYDAATTDSDLDDV